jgi:hypothetical protein
MMIKKQLSAIGSAAILTMGLATGLVLNFSQTALAFEPKDVCQYNGSGNQDYGDLVGETANYTVLICLNGSKAYYFGQPKNGSGGIALKGINYGNKYVFRNGQYTYTVTTKFLTVTKNGKVIVKEKFVSELGPND